MHHGSNPGPYRPVFSHNVIISFPPYPLCQLFSQFATFLLLLNDNNGALLLFTTLEQYHLANNGRIKNTSAAPEKQLTRIKLVNWESVNVNIKQYSCTRFRGSFIKAVSKKNEFSPKILKN